MKHYTVKPVVCDYGVYEGDELKLILNSKRIADTIVTLLQLDEDYHRALQRDLVPVNEVYIFTEDDDNDDNELSPFERYKQAAEEVLKNSSHPTHTPSSAHSPRWYEYLIAIAILVAALSLGVALAFVLFRWFIIIITCLVGGLIYA